QVEQITIALIYKFMDDMDAESEEFGGLRKFFANEFARYGWAKLMRSGLGGHETLNLYAEAIAKMPENPGIPPLFRDIFKNAYLPYRDPETLRAFLKIIDEFTYDHSERLGDAFEYLLSVLSSQGDAGQFRTPRHIIDLIVEIIDPKKTETVLDPACGTAGFLISSYKHILRANADAKGNSTLTPDEKSRLAMNIRGYDISPDMVRLSLVNMYLHGFADPHIAEYDTLTSQDKWNEYADVILANPPFMSPRGGIKPHNRFSVQSKRSEVLFVDYMAEHLTPNGRAGIIVPEGVMFQSQTAYTQLRRMLVEECLVAVVSLPAGVFNPYSGVKTSILILDKSLAKKATTIAFFKVENDGFGLGAQRRAIDKSDLPQARAEIGEYMRRLRAGESMQGFQPTVGLIVEKEKIAANGEYNLSGERYREGAAKSQNYPSYLLAEVCDIYGGSTPSKQRPRYWENGTVPWFTVEDIRRDGRIIQRTEKHVTDAALKETSLRLLPKHSVLLCCTASVGEYAFTEIELTTNQQFNGLVVKKDFAERLLPKFLYIVSSRFKEELLRLSGKTAFNFVSVGTLKTIQIPLPPLEVQKEIVGEIEGYQKVINGARAVLDNYRPHIPIRPDWPMVKLGDTCSFMTGGTPASSVKEYYEDGTIPWLVSGDIHKGVIYACDGRITEQGVLNSNAKCLPKDSVLIALNGQGKTRGTVALLRMDNATCNQSLVSIKPTQNSSLLSEFIYFHLQSVYQEIRNLTGDDQRSGLNISIVKSISIPLPPLETQLQIVAQIEAEQALVAANGELIARFEKKIQATLARVWGGDEPTRAEA
ncbi:MAG TPA: N-6 DNA methylase, partial [Thermoleophilia bacterium]|nr:N-6 DNA methylase [Thermoleophilia bacterium]